MHSRLAAGLAILGAIVVAAPVGAATALPGAPTITSLTLGPRAVTVGFKKPAVTPSGGFFYFVSCTSSDNGLTRGQLGRAAPIRVINLSAGHTYACRVRVNPDHGEYGPWSPKSATFKALKEQTTTVPDPPKMTYVHPGKGSISVGFKGLGHSGGLKVTRYVAKCVSSDGGNPNKQQGSISPIVIDHLAGAKTYTCRIAARNAKGFGEYSAPSQPVVTLAL